ncbi:MAG TPA: class I SAM-dependent methyltransferase [Allosphingosinicella sp.]|nr:class I SAM-dependent methyltransferase [Allosphingosinicella sp.]
MSIELINPANGLALRPTGHLLVDDAGNSFPIIGGVPRVCGPSNYTENFGKQWNLFASTQIDRPETGQQLSEERFFATTAWSPEAMAGENVLEVGSGAGRFSRVVLEQTQATLWSVDYSSAVEANLKNNAQWSDRLRLFQASIYELPFPDGSFDKVFCLGVLQHTPDFEASVRSLVCKAKPGGEIVVDFYPVRGWWTKVHAKYLLRPMTRRMKHARLLKLIDRNAGWMIKASKGLNKLGLHPLTRFIPVVDVQTMPRSLGKAELREWVVLDTFDMFSPEYDNPQRVETVAKMFLRAGAEVTFAGFIQAEGTQAAVVRAVRK